MAAATGEPWVDAWERTVTGPASFYRANAPQDHFTTMVREHAGIAELVITHVELLLAGLGRPSTGPVCTVTDLGSGHGMLLRQVDTRLQESGHRGDVHLVGVDLRMRPADLPAGITWVVSDVRTYLAGLRPHAGVLIAHELLDDIPLTIVELDDHRRLRRIDADPVTRRPILGPPHGDRADLAWLDRWWPAGRALARAEIGRSRDAVWAQMVRAVSDGVCLAIDYGHVVEERRAGTWDGGTCVGYRSGRVVPPVADGTCNITAHVAFDSLSAAGDDGTRAILSIGQRMPRRFAAPTDMRMLTSWCGLATDWAAAIV